MIIVKKIRSKIYRESKYLYRNICYILGLNKQFLKDARGSRIVIYHGICQKDHTRFNSIFLTKKIFEAHLKLYKKYFNIISVEDYYHQRFSNDKFNICITFDDGFENNYTYALPLLKKHQIPATFFLTAIRKAGYDILWNDFVGIISKYGPKNIQYKNEQYYKDRYNKYISIKTGISLDDELYSLGFEEKKEMMELLYPLAPFKNNVSEQEYWLQMTEEQIKSLSDLPLVSIGAHSYYHNELSKIPLADAITEMEDSKKYIEALIDKSVHSFAFPYGVYTKPLVEEAKKIGYKQLLVTDYCFEEDNEDMIIQERFTLNPFLSPINQMYAIINRMYE